MQDHFIATAILSLTAPRTSILKGEAASRLARPVNEQAAEIRESDPSTFGFFAALPPIIDNDNGDNTIEYSLDELEADGVTLFTRYGSGNVYLGHEAIKPIWAELSARKATVFIHPQASRPQSQKSLSLPSTIHMRQRVRPSISS